LIVAGIVLTLFISYYFAHSCIWNLRKICISGRDNTVDNGAQEPQLENPCPSHPNPISVDGEDLTEPTPKMRYSIYSLQSTWSVVVYGEKAH
jgi:hypothetical protein